MEALGATFSLPVSERTRSQPRCQRPKFLPGARTLGIRRTWWLIYFGRVVKGEVGAGLCLVCMDVCVCVCVWTRRGHEGMKASELLENWTVVVVVVGKSLFGCPVNGHRRG